MNGMELLSWLNRLSNQELEYEVSKCKYTVEDPSVNKQDKRIVL